MMNPAMIFTKEEREVLSYLVSSPGKREFVVPAYQHEGYMRWSKMYRSLVERKALVQDQEGYWVVSSVAKYWLRRQMAEKPV